MSQEKWFIFIILLFIVPTSLSYSFPFVPVDFFLFSFTSLSSFFTHIETDQSVGGAKTGVPGEKPPDTPASTFLLKPSRMATLFGKS